MVLQRKMRVGAVLMIIGGLCAVAGEIVNVRVTDVLSSSWRLSLAGILVGTFVLLIGLSIVATLSPRVNGLGFLGYILLLLGGLLLIIGTTALDWIIVPFLINLATIIATTINTPATNTQDALNKVITVINHLGGSTLQKLFPGMIPHLQPAHIPMANGITIVNSALQQLHLPTIDTMQRWGHISLSGGPITIGCLILGLGLLRNRHSSILTSVLLICFALLNAACQWLTTLPLWSGNITAAVLFLLLAWWGAEETFFLPFARRHSAGRGERDEDDLFDSYTTPESMYQ